MKNQYFGDNKDLFTYDLILQVMQKVDSIKHFIFVPMLTGPDGTGHGGKTNRARARSGTKNRELVRFLDECIREGRRDIGQLESFFNKQGIEMTTYYEPFSHEQRNAYFEQLRNRLLPDSLIFLDPDIGLEIEHSGEKHVLYSEIKNLYDLMDNGSILMLFQHFPRQPHQRYLNRRCQELKEKITGGWPVCIDDNEVIFFFLTKNESLEHSLTHVISDYAELYG